MANKILLIFFTVFLSVLSSSQYLAKAFVHQHFPHTPTHHHPHSLNELRHGHASEALRHSQTMSVVINPNKPHLSSFIRVLNPPFAFHNKHRIHVEYACQEGDLLAIQLFVESEDLPKNPSRVFHYHWTCSRYSHGTRQAFVQLVLPDWLAFRPDILQPNAINVASLELRAWIVSSQDKAFCIKWKHLDCYHRAPIKGIYTLNMLPVYQRPRKLHEVELCLSWPALMILNYFNEDEILRCQPEEEFVQLVDFPVAFSAANSGITKDLPPFRDVSLINQQQRDRFTPRFTFSTKIFLLEYCSLDLCSILHRKTTVSNSYITPLLFLTRKGLIHVQVVLENGQASGMLSNYKIPLRQWVHLVYTQNGNRWDLSVSNEQHFVNVVLSGSVFPRPVRYDESEGLIHLGGSTASRSFSGFMADTWLRRTHAVKKEQKSNSSTPVLLEKISSFYKKCDDLHERMLHVYNMYQDLRISLIAKSSCANSLSSLLLSSSLPQSDSSLPSCKPWQKAAPRSKKQLWRALKVSALQNQPYNKSNSFIGERLHKKAVQYLAEKGFSNMPAVVNLLRQASCYGNDESSYMLGTLYAGGINVEADQNEAYMYWLIAAQKSNRLALFALANHHYQGLNSAPNDFDFSYNYLKHLADLTVKDRERHDPNGVLTEYVRLTDTASLQVHKGEDGDHFLWLKYQARKGIAQAQLDMARILFWGQRGVERDVGQAIDLYRLYLLENPEDEIAQYDIGIIHLRASIARIKFWGSDGVKRDMKTAVKYYEKSVKEMPKNKIALYDYGIVLLRGQGTEKNVEKALEHLHKSAELGHAPAYTALGWYAINFQNDLEKAAKYFEIADQLGHRDAMHNLGYMYKAGRYPGKPANPTKALWYFQRAADRGHVDSAGVIAEIYNQGTSDIDRSSFKAAFWSRLVCEQNPGLGMALRRGLDAYLAGSWSESIVYYMMVAETGLEVAQFNLAHLCEEDNDGLVSQYLRADCMWKYYNLSSHALSPHIVSQLKMGDFHYYGHHGDKDLSSAVQYYAMAAKRNEPQALFNLAYLLEEGVTIEETVWKSLRISSTIYNTADKEELITTLYRRCRDNGNRDSYIPCGLALLRIQLVNLWGKHTLALQVSSALMLGLVTLFCITSCLRHARSRSDTSPSPDTSSTEQDPPE